MPPIGSVTGGWRNENECCLNMHPIACERTRTVLYAVHATYWESETNFRRLQFFGMCGLRFELSIFQSETIPALAKSTTIVLPHTAYWLLTQYAKPFGFHKPPFITLKNPLVFQNIHLTTDTTFLKCSSAFTYHYPFSVCKGCAGFNVFFLDQEQPLIDCSLTPCTHGT